VPTTPKTSTLSVVAPGILVAATGVGAGDLLTAGFAGAKLGLGICWAVVLGAVMKWALTEGLARYQLGAGESLLAAWASKLRLHWVFLLYLLIWSFTVGGALINACGVAGHALAPLSADARTSQMIWGAVHSLAGAALVLAGGFKLFERFMAVCVGVLFLAVTFCAARLAPAALAQAEFVNPLALRAEALHWTIGLIGGVGGTVTVLCYGYWIREERREGADGLRLCRIDLAVAYLVTAFFGIAMLIIAARTPELNSTSVGVAGVLAESIERAVGPAGRWVFLSGFWAAVFSSLLGVWQGVPYLFADALQRATRATPPSGSLTATRAYRVFLAYIALAPLATLGQSVRQIQLVYAVLGACFIPLLAASLLALNNHPRWQRPGYRNGCAANLLLGLTLAFFAWQGAAAIWERALALFAADTR